MSFLAVSCYMIHGFVRKSRHALCIYYKALPWAASLTTTV
jgi:hypothetical protein